MLECLVKPLLTNHKVINEGVVGSYGFIWAAPASVDKIESAIFDEGLNFFLDLGCLIFIPSFKEFGFSICEGSCIVFG
jgi:hypothetical protein